LVSLGFRSTEHVVVVENLLEMLEGEARVLAAGLERSSAGV